MGWPTGGLFPLQGGICKTSALGAKASRHGDASRSLRKTRKHLVTHLGLIAFRLPRHLWEVGGELSSARSFTLIVSGASTRLCPQHEGLRKGKVPASTSCSVFLYVAPRPIAFPRSLQTAVWPIGHRSERRGLRVTAARRGGSCCNNNPPLGSALGGVSHASPHCLAAAFLKSVP